MLAHFKTCSALALIAYMPINEILTGAGVILFILFVLAVIMSSFANTYCAWKLAAWYKHNWPNMWSKLNFFQKHIITSEIAVRKLLQRQLPQDDIFRKLHTRWINSTRIQWSFLPDLPHNNFKNPRLC